MTSPKWRALLAIRAWAAVFAVVSAALLAGGYGYYRMEAQRIHHEQYQNLAAIAEMRSEQILGWRKERLADASRVAKGPVLRKDVAEISRHTDTPGLRDELKKILVVGQEGGSYSNIFIFTPDGKKLHAAQDVPELLESATRQAIKETLTRQEPVLSDFFFASDGRVYIDVVAAVRDDDGHLLAVVILRSDAAAYLYPIIQSWPTPSRSAETLLVHRDGDSIVFLNQLRHRSRSALSLRLPLTQADVPAVQAARGRKGIFHGMDYRNVEVLADLRPIPDSPWFMVTKMDADEILAEARYRAYAISFVVATSILLAAVLVAYAYRRRQAGVYLALFESERQKRLSHEQFRTTLYSIGDGIITTDTESRVREMNRVAEMMTGWTEAEARGIPLETVFKIINQDTRAKVHNPVGTVLREGVVVGLANHTLLIARDGTERAIADSAAPICDDRGKVSGVVLVFSDVTEKYRVEAALKKSEQEYRMLFESMLDGFALHEVVCDETGKPSDYRFLSVNPAFERITGLSAQNVVGRTVLELLPGTEPEWIDRYGLVALTGRPMHFQEYSRALGRYFEIAAFSPKAGQFASVIADVTERKAAEEALRASEVRFRSLLQNVSSVAVWSFNLDGRVQYWNKASENLYGYTEEEALGCNTLDLMFPPETRPEIARANLEKIVATGEPMPLSELSLVRKDGSLVSVISSRAIVKTPDRPCEFFCFDIDITERKRLEAQLLRTQRMESIGTLASGVAHDLNNILAPIILSADLLRNASSPAARESLVETIETCAQRGAHIVNQVITFARGAKGEKTTLQLRHLVNEMEKIIRETFPRNIAISNYVSCDLWPVKGNATQIHQVLLNLCINARDAMSGGGTLQISADNQKVDANFAAMTPDAKPGCYAVLEISDTGTGMAHEVIGKIFDPFFTTKEVGKGTGLGLSTVIGIVRGHGGFVTVESEVGSGTTFKVYLPADKKEVAADPPRQPAPRRQGKGETILVVDDDLPICQSIASVLELNGYKALTAADGPRATSLYRSRAEEIQLVLTDISMPTMDGVELIGELQKITPQLKAIASSGQTTEESKAKLRACGVKMILHKPYDARKLLAAVAAMLQTKSA